MESHAAIITGDLADVAMNMTDSAANPTELILRWVKFKYKTEIYGIFEQTYQVFEYLLIAFLRKFYANTRRGECRFDYSSNKKMRYLYHYIAEPLKLIVY